MTAPKPPECLQHNWFYSHDGTIAVCWECLKEVRSPRTELAALRAELAQAKAHNELLRKVAEAALGAP